MSDYNQFLQQAGIKKGILSKARRFVFGFSRREREMFEEFFVNKAIEAGRTTIPLRKKEFVGVVNAGCLPSLRINHLPSGVLGECRDIIFVEA